MRASPPVAECPTAPSAGAWLISMAEGDTGACAGGSLRVVAVLASVNSAEQFQHRDSVARTCFPQEMQTL